MQGTRRGRAKLRKAEGDLLHMVRSARLTSKEFSAKLLTDTGIVVTPGTGFGKYGEGYARISTTFSTDKIIQAVERLKEVKY
ncbi:MAG: aminotransferase class I/II-fold pyridoxal phosphate-dependent enzyme [Thermodesulfobacteriota bacterium]